MTDQSAIARELARLAELHDYAIVDTPPDPVFDGIARIAAVTALYNVSVRLGADLVDAATADGAMFSPWHPVKLDEAPHGANGRPVVGRIAADHEVTPQQVALAWQLHRSSSSVPIPGTTSLEHLRENLSATELELTEEEYAEITAVAPER